MPEQTTDQMADSMQGAANTAFNSFGEALKGSGADAYNEFTRARADASVLSTLGGTAADNIRKLQADTTKPEDWRRSESARIFDNAELLMGAAKDALIKRVDAVKANLMTAIKPVPLADAGSRALVRSEIEMMVAAAPAGQPVLATLLHLVGTGHPDWDAEILSSWGTAKLSAAGEGRDVKALQTGAAYKLVQIPGGTDKQVAAKRALAALRDLKVEGHVAGFHQAGRFRLDGVRPATSPNTIVPNVMNAPTPQVGRTLFGGRMKSR